MAVVKDGWMDGWIRNYSLIINIFWCWKKLISISKTVLNLFELQLIQSGILCYTIKLYSILVLNKIYKSKIHQ